MRLPKLKGGAFTRKIPFAVIHLSDVEKLASKGVTQITVETLKKHGFLRGKYAHVKLLSGGSVSTPVTLTIHAASESAQKSLEKAGGTLSLIA
jgi:large subunit ribosomal protein L15